MVLNFDVLPTLLYKDLDESADIILEGLVGDKTPALDDFGHGVGQGLGGRSVVEAEKHYDLRYGLGDAGVDGDLVFLEVFSDFHRAHFQLFEAQDG